MKPPSLGKPGGSLDGRQSAARTLTTKWREATCGLNLVVSSLVPGELGPVANNLRCEPSPIAQSQACKLGLHYKRKWPTLPIKMERADVSTRGHYPRKMIYRVRIAKA